MALCRASSIPARLVTGFVMESATDAHPHIWVEVQPGKKWLAYDIEKSSEAGLPQDYLPVRRGPGEIVRVSDASDATTKYAIVPLPPPSGSPPGLLSILDLRLLPPKLHGPMKLLLLVPLGALVTAFFRTVRGRAHLRHLYPHASGAGLLLQS